MTLIGWSELICIGAVERSFKTVFICNRNAQIYGELSTDIHFCIIHDFENQFEMGAILLFYEAIKNEEINKCQKLFKVILFY